MEVVANVARWRQKKDRIYVAWVRNAIDWEGSSHPRAGRSTRNEKGTDGSGFFSPGRWERERERQRNIDVANGNREWLTLTITLSRGLLYITHAWNGTCRQPVGIGAVTVGRGFSGLNPWGRRPRPRRRARGHSSSGKDVAPTGGGGLGSLRSVSPLSV